VQACQERLNIWAKTAGLTSLTVDGGFGPNTLVTVQGFQKFKKLAADGIVGAATWAMLNASPVLPVNPVNQSGTVHSTTTGGTAAVTSTDAGWTWKVASGPAGKWLFQTGTVHSDTTGGDGLVVTDDGGLVWHFAGT
jgi:peptidoglycan hydrolase-like protein with peptidoglycan-binding domain